MSLHQTTGEAPARRANVRIAGAAGGLAALTAALVNLGVLLVARVAGADMVVQPPGRAAMQVGVGEVLAVTVGATLLGTLLLLALRSRAPRAWRVVGVAGLAFGVVSAAAPLTAPAGAGTRLALATMHLIAGVAWYVLVRWAARRSEAGGR